LDAIEVFNAQYITSFSFLNEEMPNTEHIVNIHVYDPESEDVIIRLLSQTENNSIFKTTNIASLFYKLGVTNITEKSLSNIHEQLDVVSNKKSYRIEKQKKNHLHLGIKLNR